MSERKNTAFFNALSMAQKAQDIHTLKQVLSMAKKKKITHPQVTECQNLLCTLLMTSAKKSKSISEIKEALQMAKETKRHDKHVSECQILLLDAVNDRFVSEIRRQAEELKKGLKDNDLDKLVDNVKSAEQLNILAPGRMLPGSHMILMVQSRKKIEELKKVLAEKTRKIMEEGIKRNDRKSLQTSFHNVDKLPRGSIPGTLLERARAKLMQLDEFHVIETFLDQSLKTNDMILLEQTLNKARVMGMSRVDFPSMEAAYKKLVAAYSRKDGKTGRFRFWKGGKESDNKAKVFGGDLKTQALLGFHGIPMCVYESIKYMSNCDLSVQGLFRVAGRKGRVDIIKHNYETRQDVEYVSIHDASSILKAYIRDLPDPLVPFENYPSFIRLATEEKKYKNKQEYIANLKTLVSQIPETERRVLHYLVEFLIKVEAVPENKMTAENLAIVFAPNILRSKSESATSVIVELPLILTVMRSMIADYRNIFPPIPNELKFYF